MTDAEDDASLQLRAWTVCCDFHDEPVDIAAHLKHWERTRAYATPGPLAGQGK